MHVFPDDINAFADKHTQHECMLREALTKKIRISREKTNFIIRTCECNKCKLNMLKGDYDIICDIDLDIVRTIIKELHMRGYSVDMFNSKCSDCYYISYGFIHLHIYIKALSK